MYTSSLYDELEGLNITSAMSGSMVAVINEGKNREKRDVGAKGGDVTGKHNNKKGGKPFLLLIIIIKGN